MAQEGWSLDQEEAPCSATTPTAAPSLCLNNCGFFGSAATMNLCSSCYKTLVLLKPSAQASTAVEIEEPKVQPASRLPALSPPPLEPASSSSASAFPSVRAEAATATAPVGEVSVYGEKGQKPLRCFACRKKVGLRGFKCRCGDVFCALHRYSDKHSCSFDYKSAGRVSIEKANPVVKADKLHRI